MIITRLFGGLGNQMFQYAAGNALASRLGVSLMLDTRTIDARGMRSLTKVFDLEFTPARDLPPTKTDGMASYALWRAFGRNPRFVRERGLGYNPQFSDLPDNVYLHGYWQSEKYFANVAEELHNAFRPKAAPSDQNWQMAEQINAGPSVSLHVRRGDYLALGAHGVCSEAYYNASLKKVVDQSGRIPTVFVFSDDPQWAHDNLPLPCPKVVVDFNGPETDYEDLRLMALCDHNIIANSSFSWWGAWLNDAPGKIVTAPSQWFAKKNMANPDILPTGWLTIKT